MDARQPNSRLYRADLLWCLHSITDGSFSQSAALLGFSPDPKTPKPAPQEQPESLSPTAPPAYTPPVPAPTSDKSAAQTPAYYRLTDISPGDTEPAPAQPQWLAEASPSYFELRETCIPPAHRVIPVYPPLVPWSRLLPSLLRVLSRRVASHKPDIKTLVKRVSLGQQIRTIPRCTRMTWSPNLRVLIDINDSNYPYRHDFLRVVQQLHVWRGDEGLSVAFIEDQPGANVSVYHAGLASSQPWAYPEADTPLFILSDLGLHSQSRRSLYAWLGFGQHLQRHAIRPVVLLPVAHRQLDPRLLAYFDCIIWDDNSTLKPVLAPAEPPTDMPIDSTARLLALVFPAVRGNLGLLRAVRQLLPANSCDVSDEAAFWQHPAINAQDDEWGWHASYRADYQAEFLSHYTLLPALQQAQLVERLGVYHAQQPDELYFEAMHNLIGLGVSLPEDIAVATDNFMKMLAKTYQQHPDHAGLEHWAQRYLTRQPTSSQPSEPYKALLAMAKQRQHQRLGTPIAWPDGVNPKDLLPYISRHTQAYTVTLKQSGPLLALSTQAVSSDWAQPPAIIHFNLNTNHLTLSYPDADKATQTLTLNLEHDLPYQFSLPLGEHLLNLGTQQLSLDVQADKPDWASVQGVDSHGVYCETQNAAGQVYRWYWHPPVVSAQQGVLRGFWHDTLPDSSSLKPEWADSAGRDAYGLYTDVRLAGIPQRLRWIPPSGFWMGSPEDEPGRRNDETRHRVCLSSGYWLADTACTQAVWSAVMGINPSEFKGDSLPVENVSWKDIQVMIKRLNQKQPELQLRLPSEAEWEYACRAGTTGSFNFAGELALSKVNYRGTWDDWDKWGDGAIEATAAVKSYPPNLWGLYEMHGNVWEWCQDAYGSYTSGAVTDPLGSATDAARVLRGGSWLNCAEDTRSASRYDGTPVLRIHYIGFRLALGHPA
ncbi:MAG: formylglycine-generating enzyme family protein [Methylococcales bacterium]|nr:formylglycine-generating enzyme family protein [Methylococcales bacterium]